MFLYSSLYLITIAVIIIMLSFLAHCYVFQRSGNMQFFACKNFFTAYVNFIHSQTPLVPVIWKETMVSILMHLQMNLLMLIK